MKKVGIGGALLALTWIFATPSVRALEMPALTAEDLHIGGYTDLGRFQLKEPSTDGEIISRVGARWHIDKAIDDRFSAMADLNWMFWRNQATDIALFHIAGLKFDADVQAALTYTKDEERIKGGLYDFKYNPDSRNLGEYLLRSEAYPTLIESSQGKDLLADANARVVGVQYSRSETESFRHLAILYAEQYSQPVYDLNLAYLAAVGTGPFEFGAGVAWARFAKFGDHSNDGSLPPDRAAYVKRQGLDTEALKFSLRARYDFAPMLGLSQGLVLYSEVALLGIKSDSLYYKDIMQRMPIMAGISLPTGGILTQLSIEAEYLKNPYYNQRYLISSGSAASPLPMLPDYTTLPNYTKDDLRWSVLVQRDLNQWLGIKLRLASDHMRLRSFNGDYEGGRPMTPSTGEWYFLARIEYHN